MKRIARGIIKFALLATPILLTEAAYAIGVGLELAGSMSDESAVWNNDKKAQLSGGISFDIGDHLQLGLLHRISNQVQTSSHVQLPNDQVIDEVSTVTRVTSNSLNLSIILYNGMVSPYVFLGLEKKSHAETELRINGQVAQRDRYGQKDLAAINPTWGAGMAIFLNTNFRLKIRQTYTMGSKAYIDANNEAQLEEVKNQYLEVGIEYKM